MRDEFDDILDLIEEFGPDGEDITGPSERENREREKLSEHFGGASFTIRRVRNAR